MWLYEKKLEYPVNIRKKNLKMAKLLLEQYGGADGEFSAAMRYLNQRYMPYLTILELRNLHMLR